VEITNAIAKIDSILQIPKNSCIMSQQLKDRTKAFAIRVIMMTREIKSNKVEDILVRQIVRSATSIGANYRFALRGRSKPDFISRITIAEEEADETCYWLEILIEIKVFPQKRLEPLLKEAQELTAILTASGRTAKEKLKK
jgi:four helix bundle protein